MKTTHPTRHELEAVVTGANATKHTAVLATRKVTEAEGADFYEVLETLREAEAKRGARPHTTFAPVDEPLTGHSSKDALGGDQDRPPRELTLFERTDIQRAEVQLQMHRRTEEVLLEQVRLAEAELVGIRRVIAGVEAQLAVHGGPVDG